MSTDRQRFEAWATQEGLAVERNKLDDDYLFGETYDAWAVWQAALAAHQPGAQEPVPCLTVNGGPVYAAPPAQGIDLGQFRKAVMVYRNFSRSNEAEADRLLALIDSQNN